MTFDERSGWYLPDHEEHLQEWMAQVNDRRDGRLLYQGKKYRLALSHVKRQSFAIDVGAHVGLWSWQMAKDFQRLFAFEPMPAHYECWKENMGELGGVLVTCALGPESGVAHLRTRTPNSSGDTGIEPDGEGIEVDVRTLDSFNFFEHEDTYPDFIKLDCEGYELFVLEGAVETLTRCHPTVIVEQKPETGMEQRYGIGTTDAVTFLQNLGAKVRAGLQGDYVLSWD